MVRLTWEHRSEDMYRTGVPLKAGTYHCVLDFSYVASPEAPGGAAKRRSVAPEAGVALVAQDKETIYGVLSLQLAAEGRVRLMPDPQFYLSTKTAISEESVDLSPGDSCWLSHRNLLGAGAVQYTFLGESHGVCRFLDCYSFSYNWPATYRYIDVRPYVTTPRPPL